MRRGYWSIVAIAALGLVLAAALAAFAHAIARSTVALPSTSLERTDERLAPAQAQRAKPAAARKATTPTTTTTTTPATTSTTTDDDRGRNRRGPGSDDSDERSDNSGRGSDDSGKGSDNSGKGSDD